MLDISQLLDEIKASPYQEIHIKSPHTGVVTFANLKEGDTVYPMSGMFKEIPGTHIATVTRERNPNPIRSTEKGIIAKIHTELENQFVEANTHLATVRHYLSKQEVVDTILKKSLSLFCAPERATYYFAADIDKKVKISGSRSVAVYNNMDLFIVSRMKREASLAYTGIEGIIYAVYFKNNTPIDAGTPLIAVCPESQIKVIEDVVSQVYREWEEV